MASRKCFDCSNTARISFNLVSTAKLWIEMMMKIWKAKWKRINRSTITEILNSSSFENFSFVPGGSTKVNFLSDWRETTELFCQTFILHFYRCVLDKITATEFKQVLPNLFYVLGTNLLFFVLTSLQKMLFFIFSKMKTGTRSFLHFIKRNMPFCFLKLKLEFALRYFAFNSGSPRWLWINFSAAFGSTLLDVSL